MTKPTRGEVLEWLKQQRGPSSPFSDMYDSAIEMLKSRQWVSVEDRLPFVNESVLICDNGDILIGCLTGRDVWRFSPDPMDNDLYHVTHWMPLPEPPGVKDD